MTTVCWSILFLWEHTYRKTLNVSMWGIFFCVRWVEVSLRLAVVLPLSWRSEVRWTTAASLLPQPQGSTCAQYIKTDGDDTTWNCILTPTLLKRLTVAPAVTTTIRRRKREVLLTRRGLSSAHKNLKAVKCPDSLCTVSRGACRVNWLDWFVVIRSTVGEIYWPRFGVSLHYLTYTDHQ